VAAEQVRMLGAPIFPTPGMSPERFFLTAAEIDPLACATPPGDGSPMEEGATHRFVPLDEAIALCEAGEIEDAKTELLLRRLKSAL
jgi:ADP-ribose pyrophosphatase